MLNASKSAIAGAIVMALLCLAAFFYVSHEKNAAYLAGKKEVQVQFNDFKRNAELVAAKALADRLQENERDRFINEQKLQEARNDYKQQLAQTITDYERRIAIDRANGGLRLPREAVAANCPTVAGAPETESAAGADAANDQGTIRLPERIETGLYAIAEKGAECQVTVTAWQTWARNNGFYP